MQNLLVEITKKAWVKIDHRHRNMTIFQHEGKNMSTRAATEFSCPIEGKLYRIISCGSRQRNSKNIFYKRGLHFGLRKIILLINLSNIRSVVFELQRLHSPIKVRFFLIECFMRYKSNSQRVCPVIRKPSTGNWPVNFSLYMMHRDFCQSR